VGSYEAKIYTNGFLLGQDGIQGQEFSGRNQKGLRVMGITSHQAIASMVLTDSAMVWDVPEYWTLEDAATVPVVYTTVSWNQYRTEWD
jgi:fatty acid synthase